MSAVVRPVELYVDWLTGGRERVYHNLLFGYLHEISAADLLYEPRLPSGRRMDIVAVGLNRVIVYEVKAGLANHNAVAQLNEYVGELRGLVSGEVGGVLAAERFAPAAYASDHTLMPLRLVRA